jgi:hypothetical protein
LNTPYFVDCGLGFIQVLLEVVALQAIACVFLEKTTTPFLLGNVRAISSFEIVLKRRN